MTDTLAFSPGQRVSHAEHGEGVVVDAERNGYVRFANVAEAAV